MHNYEYQNHLQTRFSCKVTKPSSDVFCNHRWKFYLRSTKQPPHWNDAQSDVKPLKRGKCSDSLVSGGRLVGDRRGGCMVGVCGTGLWCWSQSVKGTELGRGLHERGLMLLRYDARFESAHWNDVVGGFEDLEVQSSSAFITQNNAKRPIFYRRFCSR